MHAAVGVRALVRGLRPVDGAVYGFYLVLLALALTAEVRDTRWVVALCLSVACAVLWFVARHQLGTAFSVRPEARHLVTSGLYARVRHPVYVFGTLAFLLVILALEGWPALVIWSVLIPVQVIRARREDRLLAARFGAEYGAYRRSTWL